MALRIGGTIASPGLSSLLTWGSVRSPLVASEAVLRVPPRYQRTTYSRAFPDTTGDPYPKFFIWESGSLFSWHKQLGTVPPYYWIEGYPGDPEADPPIEAESFFGVGLFIWPPYDQVDNQQFKELIGESVDTDGGTFTITQDAHDDTTPQQFSQNIPGLYATEIYTIGKLTPI